MVASIWNVKKTDKKQKKDEVKIREENMKEERASWELIKIIEIVKPNWNPNEFAEIRIKSYEKRITNDENKGEYDKEQNNDIRK